MGVPDLPLRTKDELYFLELNPNGQWAWLDPDQDNGLVHAVVSAILEKAKLFANNSDFEEKQ